MKPLVSIITPVYNAEAFLAQTIESVLAQTYENWEMLLVIDQKSSDGSGEIARGFVAKDRRIKVLTDTSCMGVAANRNFALEQARGEYISFLDSDDLWLPEKLTVQIEFMLGQNVDFCFHDYSCIDASGADMRRTVSTERAHIGYGEMLAHNYIGCLTVAVSRKRLGSLRFYSGHHEDYCLWLDLLRSGAYVNHLGKNLALYRILSGSRSGNKFLAAKARWQIFRDREGLSLLHSIYLISRYTFAGILKRI